MGCRAIVNSAHETIGSRPAKPVRAALRASDRCFFTAFLRFSQGLTRLKDSDTARFALAPDRAWMSAKSL